jgi:hypothetical protein
MLAKGGRLRFCLAQRPPAAWYSSITLARILPRALTAKPVVFRPPPDLAAPLPPRRRSCRPACRSAAGLAGVLDERRELLTEGVGVLKAQIDLILGAVEPEPHRLIRRAASWASAHTCPETRREADLK